jgi:hypothetical protein
MASRLEHMAALATCDGRGWDQDSIKAFASHMQSLCRHAVKVRRMIKSLHFKRLRQGQSNIKKAHETTFEWIFAPNTSANLVTWLKSGDELYWISGKAGSGKSTLMKFL